MDQRLHTAVLGLALAFAAGCGGESKSDGGAGGSGAGGAGGGGGSAGTGGGTGGGGSGGTPSCDDFDNAPPAQGTTITFKNQTPQTIFVTAETACGAAPPFALADASGKSVPLGTDTCGSSCQDLQEHEQYGCPAVCMMPPILRIEPNGSYAYAWGRAVLEPASMPKSCYFAPEYASGQCQRIVEVPAGSYEIAAQAGTECAECTCKPSASGSCEAPYGQVTGLTLSAKAAAKLPSGSVEVVFK